MSVKLNKMNAQIDERFKELIFKISQKVDKEQFEHQLEKIKQSIKKMKSQMKKFPDLDEVIQTIVALEEDVRLVKL